MVALGGLAAYGGSRLPPVPGQQIGPNVFPLVVGIGLAICGGMIFFGVGRHYEEEAEADLAKITSQIAAETGSADPPAGWWRGLMALVPPALLLFYVWRSTGWAFCRRPPGSSWHVTGAGRTAAPSHPYGDRRTAIRQYRVPQAPARAIAVGTSAVAVARPAMSTVTEAFTLVLQTDVLIAILLASIYGLVVGSLPGLSATMATALLVPVTFYLSPDRRRRHHHLCLRHGDLLRRHPWRPPAHTWNAGLRRLHR